MPGLGKLRRLRGIAESRNRAAHWCALISAVHRSRLRGGSGGVDQGMSRWTAASVATLELRRAYVGPMGTDQSSARLREFARHSSGKGHFAMPALRRSALGLLQRIGAVAAPCDSAIPPLPLSNPEGVRTGRRSGSQGRAAKPPQMRRRTSISEPAKVRTVVVSPYILPLGRESLYRCKRQGQSLRAMARRFYSFSSGHVDVPDLELRASGNGRRTSDPNGIRGCLRRATTS